MKISRLRCSVLRVPFHFPLVDGEQHSLANFLEVETVDGLVGYAMSTYPMKFGISPFINGEVAPVVVGMDASRPEEVRNRVFWSTARKYYMGAWNCAMSLLDIALWDLKGKAAQQPVWKLLGGAHSHLPAYVTYGLPRYSIDELITFGRQLVGEGHKSLKMVVAAGRHEYDELLGQPDDASIEEDARRVGAVRDALGPGIDLMIDANKGANFAQALRLAKLCEPFKLVWYEDPVVQGDPRLMAKLRSKVDIPIAAGSTATSDLVYLREYLIQEAVDYLQPNVRDIGGFTQGIKAAGMAQAFNVPIAMGGNFPHLNMHLQAGAPNGTWVEYHWGGWMITQAVFDGCANPVDGRVELPLSPGLGLSPKAGVEELAVAES